MKRPRNHVIETESERIFESFLPSEWIVRKIPKDYGIDFEIELVDGDVVTGNRVWFQLKGTENIKINKGGKFVSFPVDTNLLIYAARCDFPVLLAVIDINFGEVYWLPLQNEITEYIEPKNPEWRKSETVTCKILIINSFSVEKQNDFYGLRWFSIEPARMRAFAQMHYYYHEMEYTTRLSGYSIGEGFIEDGEQELIDSLRISKTYLLLTLDKDCIFGVRGIDFYIECIRPMIEDGILACEKLLSNIPNGRISYRETALLIGQVSSAVELISTSISSYLNMNKKFLFNEGRESL